MKRYLVLGFILIFLLTILLFTDNSTYAYLDCSNMIIEPIEVTTLNLEEYIINNSFNELKGLCSYDRCYDVRENNIKGTINNFKHLYNKTLSEEESYEYYVKGYPITKLVVDNC